MSWAQHTQELETRCKCLKNRSRLGPGTWGDAGLWGRHWGPQVCSPSLLVGREPPKLSADPSLGDSLAGGGAGRSRLRSHGRMFTSPVANSGRGQLCSGAEAVISGLRIPAQNGPHAGRSSSRGAPWLPAALPSKVQGCEESPRLAGRWLEGGLTLKGWAFPPGPRDRKPAGADRPSPLLPPWEPRWIDRAPSGKLGNMEEKAGRLGMVWVFDLQAGTFLGWGPWATK